MNFLKKKSKGVKIQFENLRFDKIGLFSNTYNSQPLARIMKSKA